MIVSTANKTTVCPACGTQMAIGSPIAMTRKRYGFMHAECVLELIQLRAAGDSRRKWIEIRERVAVLRSVKMNHLLTDGR